MASSAHRRPRRDSFARGSAARWCPGATHDRNLCTGSGVRPPPAWSDATRAARAPIAGSRCHAARPRTRSGGTTGQAPRPGRRSQRGRAPDSAQRLRGRVRRAGRRGQVRASKGSVVHVEGLLDGQGENFHPRETSTSTPGRRASRRYTLICDEPTISRSGALLGDSGWAYATPVTDSVAPTASAARAAPAIRRAILGTR